MEADDAGSRHDKAQALGRKTSSKALEKIYSMVPGETAVGLVTGSWGGVW